MGQFRLIKQNSGQTLIEAIVALTVLIMVLTAASVAIVSSINNSVYERNEALATKYAQEGIEYIRQYKVGNTTEFDSYTATTRCISSLDPALPPLPTPPATGCATIGTTQYRRSALFTDSGRCDIQYPNATAPTPTSLPGKNVEITVEWVSGKCVSGDYCNKVSVESCF